MIWISMASSINFNNKFDPYNIDRNKLIDRPLMLNSLNDKMGSYKSRINWESKSNCNWYIYCRPSVGQPLSINFDWKWPAHARIRTEIKLCTFCFYSFCIKWWIISMITTFNDTMIYYHFDDFLHELTKFDNIARWWQCKNDTFMRNISIYRSHVTDKDW